MRGNSSGGTIPQARVQTGSVTDTRRMFCYNSLASSLKAMEGRECMTTQRTVLIIDDDLALQTVLEIALREAGYNVVLANDGEEGLQKLATFKPNLVISDIMMPQLDGVETFGRMKETLQNEGIPVFIMTALSRKPWFADLEAEGAVIIQKPFEIEQVLNLARDLLS